MNASELRKEIDRGKGILEEIAGISSDFLARFDPEDTEGVHAFQERRKELTEALILFCAGLRDELERNGESHPAIRKAMEEFRAYQEPLARRIAEIDSSIVTRANASLKSLLTDMAAITRGRKAMNGYGNTKKAAPEYYDKTA